MSISRKLLGFSAAGALIGAMLGITAPPSALTAAKGCICSDDGTGKYSCNETHRSCDPGSEECRVTCG